MSSLANNSSAAWMSTGSNTSLPKYTYPLELGISGEALCRDLNIEDNAP